MKSNAYKSNNNNKPSAEWTKLQEDLGNTTLMLLNRPGPTVFTLQDQQKKVFRVTLGSPHICNCHSVKDSYNTNSFSSSIILSNPNNSSSVSTPCICVHVLFCLLKVLRLSDTNPLAWQSSLTDNEIQQALDYVTNFSPIVKESSSIETRKKNLNIPLSSTEVNERHRKLLIEDGENNLCPICQEEMSAKTQSLTWCRSGCGNNMHARCMKSYCEYNIKAQGSRSHNHKTISCPLCREDFSLTCLQDDLKKPLSSLPKSVQKLSNMKGDNVKCSLCVRKVDTEFYRCVECSMDMYNKRKNNESEEEQLLANSISSNYNVCRHCFNKQKLPKHHTSHHFLSSEVSTVNIPLRDTNWIPIKNPLQIISSNNPTPRISSGSNGMLSNEAMHELMRREISSNDYSILLTLDENVSSSSLPAQDYSRFAPVDLVDHLIESLPKKFCEPMETCWCCKKGNTSEVKEGIENNQSDECENVESEEEEAIDGEVENYSENICSLSCGHRTHLKCLKRKIESTIMNIGSWYLGYGLKCNHDNCNQKIFSMLCRKDIKKKIPNAIKENEHENQIVKGRTQVRKNGNEILPCLEMNVTGYKFNQLLNNSNESTSFYGSCLPPTSSSVSIALSNSQKIRKGKPIAQKLIHYSSNSINNDEYGMLHVTAIPALNSSSILPKINSNPNSPATQLPTSRHHKNINIKTNSGLGDIENSNMEMIFGKTIGSLNNLSRMSDINNTNLELHGNKSRTNSNNNPRRHMNIGQLRSSIKVNILPSL